MAAVTKQTAAAPSSKRRQTTEQKTVNMKQVLFSEHLPVTEELVQTLQDSGIPLDIELDSLEKLSSNKERVQYLLDALQTNWNNEYFDKLCEVLETVDPWLCDELRFELDGEKGTQQVSDTLQLENSRIVFKEFGHEKRLSELEKKRLLKLLNRKTQSTRNIWENQLNRLNIRLQQATDHSNHVDQEAARLAGEIEQFITKNAAEHFKNRAVVSAARTTTDVFNNMPALQQLETQMNCLIQLSGQSILETDNINEEKRRVAQRIELKPPSTTEKIEGIDTKLSQHLEDKKRRIAECKQAIMEQQKLADKLRDELRKAEQDRDMQLAAKQRSLDEITQRAIAKDEENTDLEKAIEKLEQELATLNGQLVHYSSRSVHLERGKRLQTLFDTVTEVKDTKEPATSKSPSSNQLQQQQQLPKIVESERKNAASAASKGK